MFDLPQSTRVDRFIPKTKFHERTHISTTIRDEFTGLIERITWQYKLSEATLNVQATESVQEIQIFKLELKAKVLPQKALTVIDKSIPYPILFVLTYDDDTCYVIQHKLDSTKHYYKTEWNQLPQIIFTGANLESIYQHIITSFILVDDEVKIPEGTSFEEIVATNTKREQLQKEMAALENKIRSERQFSKKVALNTELQRKKQTLEEFA